VLAGQAGSMAPGFETAEQLAASKQAKEYWAKVRTAPHSQAAE
jgi:hypothetical protein